MDIDNGAVTNADPSPLTSHLAEMGLSDSRGFPREDDPDAGAGSLPPAQGKLPGGARAHQRSPRSADASDPFRFMHDPNAPQTPLGAPRPHRIVGPFGRSARARQLVQAARDVPGVDEGHGRAAQKLRARAGVKRDAVWRLCARR